MFKYDMAHNGQRWLKMKRLAALVLALVMVFSCSMAGAASYSQEFLDEVKAYFDDCFKARRIVGGAVVIAKDGEVLYEYAYGHLNNRRITPFTVNTHVRIASVSKMVGAVGLLHLLEEKNISLETPVKDIVGFNVTNPAFRSKPITIRQVLSHTSGILQGNDLRPDWDILSRDNKIFSKYTQPGTKYVYANLNGGLIGSMIEALTGQGVDAYMRENIFEPLGIDAAFHPGMLKDQSDIAPRLNTDGSVAVSVSETMKTLKTFQDVSNPRKNTGRTVGALYMNAHGLSRIVSMLQQGGELDGVRILSEDMARLMLMDQQTIEGSSVYCDSEYGLCVSRIEGMEGGTWYGHQGRYEGLTANAHFQPDTGLSVAIIANGHYGSSEDGLKIIARRVMEKTQDFLK